jgi:hypothetical protein
MGEETTRLREEIERTRGDLTRNVDRLAEKTSPARIAGRRVQRARGRLAQLKERVMGGPDDGEGYRRSGYGAAYSPGYEAPEYEAPGDEAPGYEAPGYHQVSQAGDRAQEAVQGAVGGVREQTEGNPLAAGLVAFGVGWLVSSLVPATQAETEAVQRAGDVAREHAGPVIDQARQSAQEVGGELKDRAREAAAQVRESTQDAAGAVREEARTSVQASSR